MLPSSFTVKGWVKEFSRHLSEQYGEIDEQTEILLHQLSEVMDAFDKSSILVVTDAEGVILEVNDTFCEISGYSREELIGRTHRIVKSKHHPPEFFEHLWKTIKSGKVWTGEIKNRKKRGSYYWVKTAIFPMLGKDGEPERFISIRTDITEGKENEEKLRFMLEEDYSNLIKNLQDFVLRCHWDKSEGAIVSLIEGKLAADLGINTEITKGMPIHHILGDEEEQRNVKRKFRLAFAGSPITFEFKYKQYFFHISLSPVFDDKDEVKEVIGSISDITALKRTELEVRNMAFHEQLTGLPNRRSLEKHLVYKLLDAKIENKKVALLLVDLDQFKNINDTLGHTAGDRFILMTAERLDSLQLENYCDNYTLYHIGGDEFLFIMYGTNDEELLKIISLILSVFQEPFTYKSGKYYQAASIGISIYPDSAHHAEELMKNADLALYVAKQKADDKYQFYNNQLKSKFLTRVEIENDLWDAVKNKGQFELHYQPIICSLEEKMVGCEALLRWHHPKKGYISPLDFITIAEETGLIVPIGEWVIDQAATDLAMWNEKYPFLKMSINISPQQIQQSNFVDGLQKMIEKHKINPSKIQLEITENGLMKNKKQAIETLKSLREKGFILAVDDFGTGYSSLSYLKQFPVHCLKIDKSFVKDLPYNQADRAIVSSTVQLGKELGLSIVAEGVECKDAQTYLQSIGCPYLQGYYYSKPLPKEKFTKYINDNRNNIYKKV